MTTELENRIRRAAEVLKGFGAKEVYLFGSAAEDAMDEYSDVDIAVAGLPPEVFFRAAGRAEDVLRRQLDLVCLDTDTPFTRYLKEEGELKRVG